MTHRKSVRTAYRTSLGAAYHSSLEDFVTSRSGQSLGGQAKLLITSPPFPLRKKKAYGNLEGEQYLDWVSDLLARAGSLLAPDGSMVVEIGNAWDPGLPTMSTLPLRTLLAIADQTGFAVCQQFICHNPARLPGPAQWVTVNRLRAKDSYTHVWWFAKDPWIETDNRRVRQPYSPSMERLLRRRQYNTGRRPSDHVINETSFLTDHGGAIPSNVLSFPNTSDDRGYTEWCKSLDLRPHPARMPRALARFFIDFLTDPGDLVMDCFAGSNTVGAEAESAGRRWIAVEQDERYLLGSLGRFRSCRPRPSSRNEPFAGVIRAMRSM